LGWPKVANVRASLRKRSRPVRYSSSTCGPLMVTVPSAVRDTTPLGKYSLMATSFSSSVSRPRYVMPKPPTPSTSAMRYSLSIAPSPSAFGYCAALVVTPEPPRLPSVHQDYINQNGLRDSDEFHLPPQSPPAVQLSAAFCGPAGGRNAGRR